MAGQVGTGTASSASTPRKPWIEFAAKRQSYLAALSRPVLECVRQRDTDHAAFYGCVDWHSSVHAHYALHALFRLTRDRSYRAAANAALTPAALRTELDALRSGALREELPYGYAWFLALASEREKATGQRDLRPLAAEITRQLGSWVRSLSRSERTEHLAADDYPNLSWALINLLEWSRLRADNRAIATWENFIHRYVTPDVISGRCLSRDRQERRGFLPPCLLKAMATIRAASTPRQASRVHAALIKHYGTWRPLQPSEIYGHSAGLNFSRGWGLWTCYTASRDTRYRTAFQTHITALLSQPRYWNETYQLYSHWVAQFGIYALALTYDRP